MPKKKQTQDWPKLIAHTKQVTEMSNVQLAEALGLAISKASGTRPRVSQAVYGWLNGKRHPPYYLKLALLWLEQTHRVKEK